MIWQTSFSIISWSKILNLEGFICYHKFTNDYIMWQKDQLFRIAFITLKKKISTFLGYQLQQRVIVVLSLTCHLAKALTFHQRVLELRDNKQVSSDTLKELLEKYFWIRRQNFETVTWNCNWNKVNSYIYYFVYGWIRKKWFWRETNYMVKVLRPHDMIFIW